MEVAIGLTTEMDPEEFIELIQITHQKLSGLPLDIREGAITKAGPIYMFELKN